MERAYHIPVLLKEAVAGLNIRHDGIYADVTFGGGGHSLEILKQLSGGRLYAFDQDEDTVANIVNDPRFFFVRHNFRYLQNFMRYYGVGELDGILADLGVSSHDFDVPERGFSFRFAGDLDMRMNRDASLTAASVLNEYPENALIRIFRDYGEVENARRLAGLLVKARQQGPICTTEQFRAIITEAVPRKRESKFLAKVFQALRIETNGELEALKRLLVQGTRLLKAGGRLAVITYHSLEDRLVKNFVKTGNFDGKVEKDFYGNVFAPLVAVNRKPIVPTEEEVARNPRSRSARLRIAEKA